MTVSLGRQLFESPAEEKIVIHRAAWPASAIEYQRIVSSVLSPVLAGIQVIDDLPGSQEGPTKISVRGLTGDEAKLLDARLPPPEGSRNKPASKGTHRWAMELPRSVRSDPRFAMGTAARFPSWLELADGPTMLVVTVISPIMNELATVFRIREGAGPKTLKGAKKAVERSIAAHRMLGLDWRPIKDLLDPVFASLSLETLQQLNAKIAVEGQDAKKVATDYLTGNGADPRKEFWYVNDDGQVVAARYDDWKVVFLENRGEAFGVWTEPFTELRVPLLFNLRRDPFEKAQHNANVYDDWFLDHAFVVVPIQALAAQFLQTMQEYPPSQTPGSFNLSKIEAQIRGGLGQ